MMGAIWQHCVPRVADEDEEDEDGATRQPETSRRSVSFGQVTVFVHEASLDASKLPRYCTTAHATHTSPCRRPGPLVVRHSDGLAPIGLGALKRKELRRLDSHRSTLNSALARRSSCDDSPLWKPARLAPGEYLRLSCLRKFIEPTAFGHPGTTRSVRTRGRALGLCHLRSDGRRSV